MAGWSPTLLIDRRAYGSQNLSPLLQKGFCNTIGETADMAELAGGPIQWRMTQFGSRAAVRAETKAA